MESALLQKDNQNKEEHYNQDNEESKLKENGAIGLAEADKKNQPAIINTQAAAKDSSKPTLELVPGSHLGAEVYVGPEIRDAINDVRISAIDQEEDVVMEEGNNSYTVSLKNLNLQIEIK